MKCEICNQDYLDNSPENHVTLKISEATTLIIWKCSNCNKPNKEEIIRKNDCNTISM